MARRRRRHALRWSEASHPPGTLGHWGRRYLEWLRVKHYSEATVKGREVYLGFFLRWCETRALARPEEVTKPMLERYQRHLFYYRKEDGRPLSFRSQHGRLVAVRALFRWLTKHNVLLYNPASELELPRLERRLPKHVLTAREAERVLGAPDVGEPLGLRDRAMLEVLYSTGIRRRELLGLSLYDFDAERGTLLVRHGKGRKDRMVPIGERAIRWVETYLREVRPGLVVPPDEGVIFLSHLGEPIAPGRLTEIVRDYVNAAAVGKKGSCHLFRHTMATLMLEGGADIRFIQQMLGHAELSTTQLYTQVSIKKLQDIHRATHPAAAGGAMPLSKVAGEEEGVAALLAADEEGEQADG
jgi:integrase/recombinase XerD